MDLSIVLVNWNGRVLVEQCLRSIVQSGTRCSYEVIVSDNASTDGSQEWLRALERQLPVLHCVLNDDNPGFGVGNNRALSACSGRYILFLNTDTIVLEPLDALVQAADALGATCGALGGLVLNADQTLQLSCREPYSVASLIAGFTFAFAGVRTAAVQRQELQYWDHRSARDVAMISGCYLLVPRRVLDQVGAFDPNIFMFFEDTDLCYRIRLAGYVVRYVPVSTIVHLDGGVSRRKGVSARVLESSMWSARYFARRHLGRWHARLFVSVVWLTWLAMWLALLAARLLGPRKSIRIAAARRSRLLGQMLTHVPRQRFPQASGQLGTFQTDGFSSVPIGSDAASK